MANGRGRRSRHLGGRGGRIRNGTSPARDQVGTGLLSTAEAGILSVVHDFLQLRDEWPRRRDLDTDPNGPVPPTQVNGILDKLHERRLVDFEGASARVALRLAATAAFRASTRLMRKIAAFLDMARQDVIDSRLVHGEARNYPVREVCARLHVGIRDVRRIAMALAPDRLCSTWLDPWKPTIGEEHSDAEMLDRPVLYGPSSYQGLVEASSGREYLERFHGVGSLPSTWGPKVHPGVQEIVLEFDAEGAVFLDGVRGEVPEGAHVETLRALLAKKGDLLAYGADDMPSRSSSREAVRRRIVEIRRALDAAAKAAGLVGFSAAGFIRPVRGEGYMMQREHDGWRIIDPDWL